jgi:hypothetical protein
MTAAIFIALVATMVFAWLSLIKIIPACATSLCRNRLWRLRDDTIDDILHGRIANVEQARRLVHELHAAITVAPDLSLINVVALNRMARRIDLSRTDHFELSELGRADRARLEPRYFEFRWSLVKNALFGSPSGWFVVALLVPMVVIATLYKRFTTPGPPPDIGDATKTQFTHALPPEPALAALSWRSGHDDRRLTIV